MHKLRLVPGRTCGECSGCCKTPYIEQTGSLAGDWCTHCVIGSGCTIYNHRPVDCRVYECYWLRGQLPDDGDRPDKIGIVIDGQVIQLATKRVVLFNLWEIDAGDSDAPRPIEIRKEILAQPGYVVRVCTPLGDGGIRFCYHFPPGAYTLTERADIIEMAMS